MKSVLLETLVVLAVGTGVALVANARSDKGLDLGRDYFLTATPRSPTGEGTGGDAADRGTAEAPEGATPADQGAAGDEGATGDGDATGDEGAAGDGDAVPSGDGAGGASASGTASGAREGAAARRAASPAGGGGPTAAEPHADEAVVAQLAELGLDLVTHDEMVALFEGEEYEVGLTMFVDARDDAHYAEGHIPGAFQLDYFYPDRYVDAIMAEVPFARRIVVYCSGGSCEDSVLAAQYLMSRGVRPAKLGVYAGGITAWTEAGLPRERGARGSGDLVE